MVSVSTGDPTWYGLAAVEPETSVDVYTADPGKDNWKLLDSFPITGFGSSGSAGALSKINLYNLEECSVRIQAGGNENTGRIDVTIDDIEFRQWRGENYDDTGAFDDTAYGSPTNIVFTQAWISNRVVSADENVKYCLLSAKRSYADIPTSIRSPRMVSDEDEGRGLGQVTFTWANAQANARLLVQIATNTVGLSSFAAITKSLSAAYWTTVTNVDFSVMTDARRLSGSESFYIGLHGVKGAMRIVVDPAVVEAVESIDDPSLFGEVTITGIAFRDEPMLDKYSWWGWNLRTTNDPDKRNLADNAGDALLNGLSFGLNNSVVDDIRNDESAEQYKKKLPFLQTPTFATNLVNEVSFLARLYDPAAGKARVTLYGAKSGDVSDESVWSKLRSWDVTNTTFEAYSQKFPAGNYYQAFRLAVTGVDGVTDPMRDDDPLVPAQRVLLDEVLVMEGINASVGFRNVGVFRTGLDEKTAVANVPSKAQQPLVGEEWGVQCEVYAAQLADEIDLSNARVRLWWYEDVSPWGFDNWKTKPGAQKAWLAPASDSNLVFRSGYYGASGAVMRAQPSSRMVQWSLEVIYSANGQQQTNWLNSAEWERPSWYAPLDYNADYGSFSAYTILDTVAPGWAWINEVNIFGEYDYNFNNSDKSLQFIEIAAPAEADLSDWTVRILDAKVGGSPAKISRIVTNDVAVFGVSLPGKKSGLKGMDEEAKMVFHVVGSPFASGVLPAADGRLDGFWAFSALNQTSINRGNGEIETYYPVSIQLVRPSGVVEHEITVIGTNEVSYMSSYNPETAAALLNGTERGGRFIYAGGDEGGMPDAAVGTWSRSLGVFAGSGESAAQWSNANLMTPGRLNAGQTISSQPPVAKGSALVIYSILNGENIWQTFGAATDTTETVTIVYKKGSENNTNITYRTAKWHELGSVTVNGRSVLPTATGNPREWTLAVGAATSNDITVVASSQISADLEELYGIPSTSRYRKAIVSWLMRGKDAYGRQWHNPDATNLGLADFADIRGNVITNLTLTEMYWLDIDPTWSDGDIVYKAGVKIAPSPRVRLIGGFSDSMTAQNTLAMTNVVMSFFMQITNTANSAAWAPYVLQGVDFENNSWVYTNATANWAWTNATFKVTGILANKPTGATWGRDWVPLRWFVFTPDSFDENFMSKIELHDPYSTDSPGWAAGWKDWVDRNGWAPVFFSWDISERGWMTETEILKKENMLE